MASQYANTQDAVSANRAECFVTLDGRRYSMMMAKEFEGKASIGSKEVYMLGNPVVGHKAQTVNLKFSMTIYKCTEIFDPHLYRLRAGRRCAAVHVQGRGRLLRAGHRGLLRQLRPTGAVQQSVLYVRKRGMTYYE